MDHSFRGPMAFLSSFCDGSKSKIFDFDRRNSKEVEGHQRKLKKLGEHCSILISPVIRKLFWSSVCDRFTSKNVDLNLRISKEIERK